MVKIEKIKFSKTINALRGISIVGVLFYHAKFDLFQGGFLGVDVFFVISGYLIGNLLLSQDLQKKSVDMMKPLIDKAKAAIDKVASNLGYEYVLDSSAGGSVIIAKGKDIMAEVKKELGF